MTAMTQEDIRAAFVVLQGAVSMALPDLSRGRSGDYEKEKKQRELVEAAIGAAFQIVETVVVDLHRIADALNEPNEYGEIGSAALAGAITRGLRK